MGKGEIEREGERPFPVRWLLKDFIKNRFTKNPEGLRRISTDKLAEILQNSL